MSPDESLIRNAVLATMSALYGRPNVGPDTDDDLCITASRRDGSTVTCIVRVHEAAPRV